MLELGENLFRGKTDTHGYQGKTQQEINTCESHLGDLHGIHLPTEAGARRHVPKPNCGEGHPGEVDRGYEVPAFPFTEDGSSSKDVKTHEHDGDSDGDSDLVRGHVVLRANNVLLDVIRRVLRGGYFKNNILPKVMRTFSGCSVHLLLTRHHLHASLE